MTCCSDIAGMIRAHIPVQSEDGNTKYYYLETENEEEMAWILAISGAIADCANCTVYETNCPIADTPCPDTAMTQCGLEGVFDHTSYAVGAMIATYDPPDPYSAYITWGAIKICWGRTWDDQVCIMSMYPCWSGYADINAECYCTPDTGCHCCCLGCC